MSPYRKKRANRCSSGPARARQTFPVLGLALSPLSLNVKIIYQRRDFKSHVQLNSTCQWFSKPHICLSVEDTQVLTLRTLEDTQVLTLRTSQAHRYIVEVEHKHILKNFSFSSKYLIPYSLPRTLSLDSWEKAHV